MRTAAVFAAVLGGGVLLLPGPAAAAAPKPTYVGIVIGSRFGCVRWHAGITGDEVLNDAATVTYRSDGIVLTIDGNPDPPHADDTHFWSYWHDTGGQWHYSEVGASGYRPLAGTVEGWSYDNGQTDAPPPSAHPTGLYAGICGARDKPAPQPSAPPSKSPSKSPARSSAKPTSTPTHSHRATAAPTHPRSTTDPTSSVPAGSPTSSRHSERTSRHPSRANRHDPAPASPGPSTAAAPAARPAAQSLQPLHKVADASTPGNGSPVPLLLGAGAVVLLGAGGAWTALRRRRAG